MCLERHKEELAVRQARVLYLESITSEDAVFRRGQIGGRNYRRCQDGRLGGRQISESLGALPDVLKRVSLLLRGSALPGAKLKECLRLGPVLH